MKVLDKGFLEIVDHMGSDATTVNSARVSFAKRIDIVQPQDERLIDYLAKHGHVSPFYHSFVTLRWKCPISVQRQLERHRVGTSMNSESTRYTEVKDEFYIPDKFRTQSKTNKQGSGEELQDEANQTALQLYVEQCERSFKSYKSLIDLGVARELAREVLPLCTYTSFIWTASLAAVAHFINLRDEDHAQYEIRAYAKAMRELVEPLFPHSIAALTKS